MKGLPTALEGNPRDVAWGDDLCGLMPPRIEWRYTSLPAEFRADIARFAPGRDAWENYRFLWCRQENFTLCMIRDTRSNCCFFGVTKRNPHLDEDNYVRAQQIALCRAVKDAYKYNFAL